MHTAAKLCVLVLVVLAAAAPLLGVLWGALVRGGAAAGWVMAGSSAMSGAAWQTLLGRAGRREG